MALQHGFQSRRAHASIDPGRLDRRVSLQYPIESSDAVGGIATAWFEVAEVWAAKRPLSGARLFAAEMKNALDLTVFRIRHRTDVASFWRLVHGDDVYEIVPPVEELGRRHFLDLTCRAVNQTAGAPFLLVNLAASDTSLQFQIKDPTRGTAVSLSGLAGATLVVKAGPAVADTSAIITKTLAAGLLEVTDATGATSAGAYSIMEAFLSSADLAALTNAKPFYFELRLTLGGATTTYARGVLTRRPPP